MPDHDWRGSKQEKLRLYWKVREERKQLVREKLSGCSRIWENEERGCGRPMKRFGLGGEECGP